MWGNCLHGLIVLFILQTQESTGCHDAEHIKK